MLLKFKYISQLLITVVLENLNNEEALEGLFYQNRGNIKKILNTISIFREIVRKIQTILAINSQRIKRAYKLNH